MRLVRAGASAAASRIALVSVSAALLAAGCHVPGTGGSGSATTGSGSITVAAVPGVDDAPLQIGVQDGLFRQHGLSVTIQTYSNVGQEIAALNSGRAQVAAGDYTGFFYAQYLYGAHQSGGANLSLIADGYDAVQNSMAILTLPRYNITAPQDLVNQTVASPPLGGLIPNSRQGLPYNMPTLAAEQVLQSDGLSPTSVSWRPTPAGSMIRALGSGQVRAILVTEPYIFEAEARLGAVEVVDSSNGITQNLPLSGYFSLASYAKQQSSNLQAFQAALSQAQGNASMGGGVQAMLPQFADMSQQDAAMATLGTYPTALSVGQVQRVVSLMVDSGMINNPVNVTSMVFKP
jgi:ABC-type nitrate/sulfonate/bicarbonate transport system substrate-binding protein